MQSLGVTTVATAGTPVRLTSNTDLRTDEISFQPTRGLNASGSAPTENTGTVYVMIKSTAKDNDGDGILFFLSPGQPAVTLRTRHPLDLRMSDIYIDADEDGDGVLVSYV